MVPLASLGGHSPYEVVTGLKPRMPAALTPGHPVQYLDVNEYVGRLQQYFQETYAEIQAIQCERAGAPEPRGEGRVSAELKKGDIVLVKREPTVARAGPLRFQERVYPDLYRVIA